MTIEERGSNAADDTVVDDTSAQGNDGGSDETNTVEYWKEKAQTLEAESTKHRKARQKAADDLKNAKKGVGADGQDYKKLWESETTARTKLVERTRSADVKNAAQARLTKAGIKPDAIEAALGLIDVKSVEWDEDDGVDDTSVNAAVATLKTKFAFMFEKKVATTTVKVAADGKSSGTDNEMGRKEFDKLPAKEKAARIAKGLKVVD